MVEVDGSGKHHSKTVSRLKHLFSRSFSSILDFSSFTWQFFFVGWQKLFCESSLKASKWFHSLPPWCHFWIQLVSIEWWRWSVQWTKREGIREFPLVYFSNKRGKEGRKNDMMHEGNTWKHLKVIIMTINIFWWRFHPTMFVHLNVWPC